MSTQYIHQLAENLAYEFLEETMSMDLPVEAKIFSEINNFTEQVRLIIHLVKDNMTFLKTVYYVRHVSDINRIGLLLRLLKDNFMTSDL